MKPKPKKHKHEWEELSVYLFTGDDWIPTNEKREGCKKCKKIKR